jgi:hypothetical protein
LWRICGGQQHDGYTAVAIGAAILTTQLQAIAIGQMSIEDNQWKIDRFHGFARLIQARYAQRPTTDRIQQFFQPLPRQLIAIDDQHVQRGA